MRPSRRSPATSLPTRPSRAIASSSTSASPERMCIAAASTGAAPAAPPVRAGDGARRPNAVKERRRRGLVAAVFLLPAIILFCVFFVGPAGRGVFYSFTDYRGYGDAEFVGVENYA